MLRKFAIPTLFAITCAAHADMSYSTDPCPTPQPCYPAADPCAPCAQLWPSKGPNWIVTPNAGPCVSDGADAFVTAEFIYWTAREDHLGYILSTGYTPAGSTSTATSAGSISHPDWKMRPGFKVGLGMLFDHDGWDLYANYTWLRFNNMRDLTQSVSNRLLVDALWQIDTGVSPFITACTSSSANWGLHFNVVDLELGRNFFVSRCLQLRPHFGFKGTWQKQTMVVNTSRVVPQSTLLYSTNKMDNWGIGLRTGLDSAWHFTKSFSLVGEAAITALWEQFEVSRSDFVQNLAANTYQVYFNFKNNLHTIKPIVEVYLGLRWESWFSCDAYHVSVEAGWEEQFWSDQNQFASAEESKLGDLSLQGLTVKARFDF